MSTERMEIPVLLKKPFKIVSDDFTFTLHIFKQYRQLFGHSEKRVLLLNETAPSFFEIVQICLMDYVILGASKLLDPAKKNGNKNATLEWLETIIKANGDETLALKLSEFRTQISNLANNLRKNRDKRIAHSDRPKACQRKFYPYSVSRKDIKDILKMISDYLNMIKVYYANTPIRFDVSDDGEAETLLYILADGLRYNDLVKDGSISYLDKNKNQ